jgi:hypothetical protein
MREVWKRASSKSSEQHLPKFLALEVWNFSGLGAWNLEFFRARGFD